MGRAEDASMGEVDMLEFGGMHAAAAVGVQKLQAEQGRLSDCEVGVWLVLKLDDRLFVDPE
jgi:hypothetical protein